MGCFSTKLYVCEVINGRYFVLQNEVDPAPPVLLRTKHAWCNYFENYVPAVVVLGPMSSSRNFPVKSKSWFRKKGKAV